MRTLLLLTIMFGLLAAPAVAQDRIPVPDVLRYAEFAPASSVLYAAIRADAGYREQTAVLLDRLEPLIGRTDVEEILEDFFNSPDLVNFLGDGIAITVLTREADFDDLLGSPGPVAITIGIRDPAAARAFIDENSDVRPVERNGWLDYAVDDEVRALMRDDVLIVTPDMTYADQLVSGDYGKLTGDAEFIASTGRLPGDRYDFVVYGDLGEIVIGREASRAAAANAAAAGLLGKWAVGGVNVGGRDLLVDLGWSYGDLSGMQAFGFAPEMFIGPEVDLNFARHLAPDTQFYAQTVNFGGMLTQFFDLLNVAGALMSGDASTEFFGLEDFINERTGDTVKSAAALALAAATGLNLEADVLNALEGDFALHFSIVSTRSSLRYAPSMGIVLAESGQGDVFRRALVNTLDRAGMPISRVTLRGGDEAIDLSGFTDPFFADMTTRDVVDDPNYDVWFGVQGGVMSLGTAPSVQFALQPGEESLASTPAFQHAVASTFLAGAQGIAFINVGALAGFPDVPAELTGRVESLSASTVADMGGMTVRLAVTLK